MVLAALHRPLPTQSKKEKQRQLSAPEALLRLWHKSESANVIGGGVQRDAKGHLSKQAHAIQPRLSFPALYCADTLRIIMCEHCLDRVVTWPGEEDSGNKQQLSSTKACCLFK